MKTELWLAFRLLFARKSHFFSPSGMIALAGLTIGVSCLVVSMAVMSGFEKTLRRSVIDVTGHLQIFSYGQSDLEDLSERIKKIDHGVLATSEFANLEGVVAHEGQLQGVLVQGVEARHISDVLNIRARLSEGKFTLSQEEKPQVLIGKGLAHALHLKSGDMFSLVIPVADEVDPSQFRRRKIQMQVAGVLDFGKFDYDERVVIADLRVVQELGGLGQRAMGLLVRLEEDEKARETGQKIYRELGPSLRVRDWRDVNENLYQAVQIERVVIFFIVLVIVIAAAFNVASSLYISVVKRYSDIGVLKALGLTKNQLVRVFSYQGLMVGVTGLGAGVILGIILCQGFAWAEKTFSLIPGSIYKIDRIDLSVRPWDLLAITVATLLICFLATLSPAFRGASLTPVEGLRHE